MSAKFSFKETYVNKYSGKRAYVGKLYFVDKVYYIYVYYGSK